MGNTGAYGGFGGAGAADEPIKMGGTRAGRLTRSTWFRGEGAGEELRAAVGAMGDGRRICTFYTEQRTDGYCSCMDAL